MDTATYRRRRGELEAYFDRTASEAWARLTSDAPVSGVRATVRAGRDRMRSLLRSYLPDDLSGLTILDAGCGTGAFTIELAEAGARVVAIDLSPTLVGLARDRAQASGGLDVEFRVGDMLEAGDESFDFVVAMDSLIHYRAPDMLDMLSGLARRAQRGLIFTFAPRTLPLAAMHFAGRFFPRGDRSPAIEPIAPAHLSALLAADPRLEGWNAGRSERVASGFYTSQTMEVLRS